MQKSRICCAPSLLHFKARFLRGRQLCFERGLICITNLWSSRSGERGTGSDGLTTRWISVCFKSVHGDDFMTISGGGLAAGLYYFISSHLFVTASVPRPKASIYSDTWATRQWCHSLGLDLNPELKAVLKTIQEAKPIPPCPMSDVDALTRDWNAEESRTPIFCSARIRIR